VAGVQQQLHPITTNSEEAMTDTDNQQFVPFIEYWAAVDTALRKAFGIDTSDAGIDADVIARAQEANETPEAFAQWFGEKHNLTYRDEVMLTAGHTPGPWYYNRDEGGMHGHVISTGDYVICELSDEGTGAAPHLEANARLIAAAPCLLSAAELVIERWASGDLAGAVRMLDAVVSTAKGGAA
jgi:hypothetical protein